MRESTFPFPKFRDWSEIPATKPLLDEEAIKRFARWQQRIWKKPILEDITASYRFRPTVNGVQQYINGATRKLLKGRVVRGAEEARNLMGIKKRQRRGVAISTEKTVAKFWAVADVRKKFIDSILYNPEEEVDVTTGLYSADAIADYGYCILHLEDKRRDASSEGLKARIEVIAPGIGATLESFGNYSIDNPSALTEPSGLLVLRATAAEQTRRINYWRPKHEALMDAFPTLRSSEEIGFIALSSSDIIERLKV